MDHRKSKHLNTVAFCRNKLEGKCNYTDAKCWWNHMEKQGNNSDCFICSKTFENKSKMIIHRKNAHKNVVKSCSQFNLGKCMFRDETCWFSHDVEAVDETNENVEEDETDKSEQVFQKVKEKTKPPLQGRKEQKKI